MEQQFMDYGSWMNLLKGNYRKGANALRGILSDPSSAAQMTMDGAAIMAIYGDVDYSDGSCLCANVIGETEFAPAAFNHYLNLTGISDYDTWAESAADSNVMSDLASKKLSPIVANSPMLAAVVPKRNLEEDSWEKIHSIGSQGLHSVYYSAGDEKNISLSGIGDMTLEIADFDHDYLSGSVSAPKAPITFLCKDLLYDKYSMSSSASNSGGFPSSGMRITLSGTILSALPADLRAVIRPIYKWYLTGNRSDSGKWDSSHLWIPLAYEMFGEQISGNVTEHTIGNARQYPIFTDNASRVKKMNNGAGSPSHYWLGSTPTSADASFYYVGMSGNYGYNNANNELGACFGFCV